MAGRRMFAKAITEDDHFLELSASAQALYLHLSMSADDDGFCNQVSIAMFRAHASVQDLAALLEKRYIYQFENGVIVIKHWRMANALRKDRYTPTNFKEELAQLKLDENGAYTRADDVGCQLVADWLPQDRLGKDRLGKDRLGEDSLGEYEGDSLPATHINYQKIVDAYNETCIGFPQVQKLTKERKAKIKSRLANFSEADLQRAFEKISKSDFAKGSNWCSFDWLMKSDGNLTKVLEGNYDNNPGGGTGGNKGQKEFDWEKFWNC